MNIEGKHSSLTVYNERGGFSASRCTPRGSLHDPAFCKELLNDEGNGASLQAANPRQIRTRDALAGSNLIENQVAIHSSWCPVGGAQLLLQTGPWRRHHRSAFSVNRAKS